MRNTTQTITIHLFFTSISAEPNYTLSLFLITRFKSLRSVSNVTTEFPDFSFITSALPLRNLCNKTESYFILLTLNSNYIVIRLHSISFKFFIVIKSPVDNILYVLQETLPDADLHERR